MSTDSPSRLQQQPADNEGQVSFLSRSPRLFWFGLPAVILFSVILIFTFYTLIDEKTPGPVDPPEVVDPPKPDEQSDSVSETDEDKEKPFPRDLLAIRTSQLGSVQVRFRRLESCWDELNLGVGEWYHDLPKRLEGDDGRRLASDRSLVESYMVIKGLDRMSLAEVAELKQRIIELEDDLELAEVTIEADHWRFQEEELQGRIDTAEEEITEAAKVYEDHVLMVKVLLGQAARLQIHRDALEEVIDTINEEEKKKRIERVRRASEAAKEGSAKTLVDDAKRIEQLKGDIGRLKSASDVSQQEATAQAAKDQAAHEKEMRKVAEEMVELERQYELQFPAMEEYLKPFTSAGYTQPTGRTYQRTTTKGPVSYNALLGAGVLGEDKDSVALFYNSTVTGNNDRELGAFPPHSFSSGHLERHFGTILKTQAFLRKFGPVLVKREKLAK